MLGACVPPAVGDSYCGPAAKVSVDGCVFRSCADNELLDAATGACVAKGILPAPGSLVCGEGGSQVVAQGRFACVSADAACPRGTGRSGALCPRPPRCPPGSLVAAGTSAGTSPKCRSVVTEGVHDSLPRVDLGAWSSLVLGPDGGAGTEELCRPLALRPDAFGVPPGSEGTVTVQLSVLAPDQDLTRVHVGVRAELTVRAAPRPLSAEAEAEIDASVTTLVEPLRGLGGEASTGLVELKVRCKVRSL